MPGNEINADWRVLEKIAQEMDAYAAALNADVTELVNRQMQMAHYWEGEAYDAFTRKLYAVSVAINEETKRLVGLSQRTQEKAEVLKKNSIID